ncbi:TetR/AcrR family transcriptional regulator C-terminal domain-containing protein [Streptosporangium sp. CA-115845]|uniref:TetR/AcrR family transcriptional regulator C-terminal domain-containing protein n=1 Tax=Streptosporangium sp. CA-115845 TaxID=3240071 RepID=UPI003D922CCC
MSTPPRRRGRPRRTLLSAPSIYLAALDLLDREGSDAFSLVKLAKELGVQMASLYNHVDNREQVIQGVRGLLAAEIGGSIPDRAGWEQMLGEWARSYRAVFARHPNTVKLLATTPVKTAAVLDQYEQVVVALENSGWPLSEVLWLMTALESFVLGSVLDMVAPEQMIDLSADAHAHPRLMAAKDASPPQNRADAAFEFGLAALLAGFRERLTKGG